MKKALLTLWNLSLLIPMFYTMSCGPSKEEIEYKKAMAMRPSYKIGDVVYLKPDSSAALITGTDVSFTSNYDSAYVVYYVLCRGLESKIKGNFIYGIKNGKTTHHQDSYDYDY